jgi:hypothetical protein
MKRPYLAADVDTACRTSRRALEYSKLKISFSLHLTNRFVAILRFHRYSAVIRVARQ